MSRTKRVRKARMAARLARRREKAIVRFSVFLAEMRERVRFRRELNKSDAPDAVKTVLGLLVDPVGFTVDLVGQKLAEGEQK